MQLQCLSDSVTLLGNDKSVKITDCHIVMGHDFSIGAQKDI